MQGKNEKKSKRIIMKIRSILIIFLMHSIVLSPPIYGETVFITEKKVIPEIMPYLELDDASGEEQDMLDTFEATKPTSFWIWVQKLGGAFIARYTLVSQMMRKKVSQVKGWWYERKPN